MMKGLPFKTQTQEFSPKFIRPEILLHPNIPKPLHGLAPRTILGDDWWDEVRQKAYAENNYCCWACGVSKTKAKYYHWLEAHECYKIDYKAGTMEMIEIVALCHSCHNFIHSGRLLILYEKGEISKKKYSDIHTHGSKILNKRKVNRNPYIENEEGSIADWKNWRLILNGEEYKGKFENMLEWYRHYNP